VKSKCPGPDSNWSLQRVMSVGMKIVLNKLPGKGKKVNVPVTGLKWPRGWVEV
jgi:hypothetical protein